MRLRNPGVRRPVSGIAAFVTLASLPTATDAEVAVAATTSAQYDYNSNVFDLQSGATLPIVGYTKRSDWSQDYGASLQLNEIWGRQTAYLVAAVNDQRYGYYTFLNHTDYRLKGGLNWKLASVLEGKIDVTRTRSMVPFSETLQSRLALQTEQRENVTMGWLFAPDWRLDTTGYHRVLDEPLASAPDLSLSESFGETTLNYVGRAGLTVALDATYLTGSFSGSNAEQNASYHQYTVGSRTLFQPTARSSFTGELGFTRRDSALQIDTVSGLTGKLAYDNQLTPKTAITVNVARSINTYVTGSGAEFDTAAGLTLRWQATYRIRLSTSYSYTRSFFPGQGELPDTDRTDHIQVATFAVDYQPRAWIVIRPYFNLQERRSDFAGAPFNANQVGISFNVYWSCAPPGTPAALQAVGTLACRT